ncbi:MAG: M28 family peptidase, partial [Acidobacteria bacterium]|nr:M28 family peptidase [Acidobacteriota bacterium]
MRLHKLRILAASVLIALLAINAISVDRIKAHVTWLADLAREGRRSGSPGAIAAAEYIEGQFKTLGYTVQMQDFGRNRRNVVARFGAAEQYVLIGSHYDGQGPGFASASDNATGIAVMLDIARDLKDRRLPASLVFIAFDDEEQGLNGSRYYSDNPIYPLEKASAAIIFDTMGRTFMDLSNWTLFVLGSEYSKELAGIIEKRSRPEMLVAGTDLIGPRSDFAPFALKKVPFLFFTHATHKDYHGVGDTADRVNYTRLAQDATLIAQIIEDIARLQIKPAFLSEPIYPAREKATLISHFETVLKERKDLSPAYTLMFKD